MLPKLVQDMVARVKNNGENLAVKVETPDLIHSTHETVDMLTLVCPKEATPSVYVVRPDRLTEYVWEKGDWGPPQELPLEKSLETVERSRNSFAVFIFWDISQRLDDRDGQPSVRCFIPQFFLSPKATRKLLVFLEPLGTQYPSIVTPYITSITEHYPSKEELLPMVRREVSQAKVDMAEKEAEISSALLGLTYTGAQQMLRLGLNNFREAQDLQRELINYLNRQKESILAHTLGMSILKPTSDDIPYGLDLLMNDLKMRRHVICVDGQDREKGWLLIGTPGSGKSLLAKYLGHQLGYPAISFNISSIMNSLVGQTEKNMYNLCKVLETFAPCILYIDEFEKAISGGHESDGGTMTRALSILFTWLNDTNAPIFMLGSANNLDPQHGLALTRRGRFSQIYWVGEPCHQARHDIAKSAFMRRNKEVPDDLIRELADKTCYFSGSDLVWLINEAVVESEHYGYGAKDSRFRSRLMELIEENRGRVETMKANYDSLRHWAKAYCKPAGLTPEK
jgi:hypothetical protein